jgi:hypothetical protein
MPMQKVDAIRALGGSISEAAKACRVTPQAVSGWPDTLTDAIEDRVVAALARNRMPTLVADVLRQQAADLPAAQEG